MACFEERLGEAQQAVEARLTAALDRAAVDTPARLVAAMRHAVLGGGKRFRPFLVLEVAALHGAAPTAALDVAAALELVHCYSLVHDDLPAMDNDELRRGRPTVWKAFDDWTAILAGDALLTLAFEVAAAAPLAADRSREIVARLARAAGPAGMVGGQVLDLEAEKLGEPLRADEGHIARLQAMKTGALIAFACEAGAVAAGAEAKGLGAMTRYGRALGAAFQLSDDLLDVEGDAAAVGKRVGKDAGLNKATLVALLGPAAARQRLDEQVSEALSALEGYGPEAESLRRAAVFMRERDR